MNTMNRDNELTYLIDVGARRGVLALKITLVPETGAVLRSSIVEAIAPRNESEDDLPFLSPQSVEGRSVSVVLENARKMLAEKHRGEIRIYPMEEQV